MGGTCPLCHPPGPERVLWADRHCRVILVGHPDHPALCRVIWQRHVREMTDLRAAQRAHVLRVVLAVEKALRRLARPVKINLASLGNQVPHLHWHVVPRFRDDAHFPDSVWSARRRRGSRHAVDATELAQSLRRLLGAGTSVSETHGNRQRRGSRLRRGVSETEVPAPKKKAGR
jgi:diadenosine tetraphosphate (Ap4A) HIT family hydrolase